MQVTGETAFKLKRSSSAVATGASVFIRHIRDIMDGSTVIFRCLRWDTNLVYCEA